MIEIGMILEEETCDSIELSLSGHSKKNNVHIEHWLVKEIYKNGFELYNLDTQRTIKVTTLELKYKIKTGWYKISKEVG